MEKKLIKRASKVWRKATNAFTGHYVNVIQELDLHRRALQFFQVGSYHYMVVNLKTASIEFVSDSISETLGYSPEEVTLEFLLKNIHPDDKPYFTAFEETVVTFFAGLPSEEYMHYKVRHDYRFKNTRGRYIRMLNQLVFLELNESDKEIKTLLLQTDISEIKPVGTPVLSIIGMNNRPSYLNMAPQIVGIETQNIQFSGRETEVLLLFAEGCNNAEVATRLGISELTVQRHRKNILSKAGANNIQHAIKRLMISGSI